MRQARPLFVLVVASVIELCNGQSGGTASDSASTSRPSDVSATATTSSSAVLASSTSYTGDLRSYLEGLPSCAAPCVAASLSKAQCHDKSCLCSDQTVLTGAMECVTASCDFRQQLSTKNSTEAACNRKPRDRSGQYDATSIAMCAVTGVLVLMRLVFKLCFSHQRVLKPDDWVIILVSVFVGLPCTVLNTMGLTHNGLGKDVWTLPPATVAEFARFFYIQQILYIFLMTSIKTSLLCFYLTIFPGKMTRLLLWITVAASTSYGVSFIFVSIFQCAPVRFYWMQYVQEEHGQCVNINLLGWFNGASSVGLDVWMIAIPLSQIKKLELHWKKKIGAAIMFLTGTCVTIVSILRLQSLLYFYSSANPTWDLWHTAWWSTIEINIGIICACLPTLRLILVRIWPRVFGSTINSTMAKSRASRANSMLVRRHQVRIASPEIPLENASSTKVKEEQWEPSPTAPEEQWDENFYHAK